MKITTRHFGELETPSEIILSFSEGIPGFPDSKRFILIEEPKRDDGRADNIFYWLQSVDDPDLALMLMDVVKFMPSYDPQVDVGDIEDLEIQGDDPFFVYNVLVIPEQVEKMTVNLKAPIVINDRLKKGKQVISQNEDYSMRYLIYEELMKK